MKTVVHIFGASGSGTSTLGRVLSEQAGFRWMDSDDYFWLPTEPRYTTVRAAEERVKLMLADLDAAEQAVISGSLMDWGNELIPRFTLAVRLVTPTEVRIERIKQREYERFGDRVLPGGDMYEQHLAFYQWAEAYDDGPLGKRSRRSHDEWQKRLACPLIVLSGEDAPEENVKRILEALPR